MVINIFEVIDKIVMCSVVYCNLCDYIFEKKIMNENIVIVFKILFYKLDFGLFEFVIYKLEVVVNNVIIGRYMVEFLIDVCS